MGERVNVSMGKPENKTRPAQRDSGMSKLPEVRRQETEVRMKTENCKNKTRPAQRDSKMSNLVLTPRPLRPLRLNLLCAQRGSGISILDGVDNGIFTIQVENKTGFWACGWDYENKNTLPQWYSKMSILKIKTENSFPQRYSKCPIWE